MQYGKSQKSGQRTYGKGKNSDAKNPYYKVIGKKGGSATRDEYGPDFYKKIGKLGGESRFQQLCQDTTETVNVVVM